jgi:hypothetical protein
LLLAGRQEDRLDGPPAVYDGLHPPIEHFVCGQLHGLEFLLPLLEFEI